MDPLLHPMPPVRQDGNAEPQRGDARGLQPSFLGFLGPYRKTYVPPLFAGSTGRLTGLIRERKLYLTLQDAIALAIENNLDVEAERYNLMLAKTDLVRAAGGGSLRGIDYTVSIPQNGVGGPGSPLLNADTVNSNPTTPTVTDLTSLNSTTQTQRSLSQLGAGFNYAPGPSVPLFDPQLIGDAGYLRRSDTVTLTGTAGTAATTGTGGTGTTSTQPLDFAAVNVAYMQGFSTGLQLEAIGNNDSQVIYGAKSKLNPFYFAEHVGNADSAVAARVRAECKSALSAYRESRSKDFAPAV